MKNAIILHGLSSKPTDFWFPYLKKNLELKGYDVWVPQLPKPEKADLSLALPYVLTHGLFTKDTIVIGHSSGASLILAILDSLKSPIHKAILVSGFLTRGKPRPDCAVKEESVYQWEKMKQNVKELYIINSTNDPWGCNDAQGRRMFDHLGGTLIINQEGHMGSTDKNQPYRAFPLLVKLIEL